MVLRSMGFDQTFDLLPADPELLARGATGVATEAADVADATESPSPAALQRTMLDVHRALVRLSEAGRLEFEPVVACLERDLRPLVDR